nr:reverse transcriptase domain-containing protein [Tanacetum cinerariifolium]
MTQLTSMCEMVCQIFQKKQEEKRIEEEQAANARYWKIPTCCDDDDDYDSAITPVLSTEEPMNSLSMRDEHLDTIPATKSDEVIKSSVEDLVPIPKSMLNRDSSIISSSSKIDSLLDEFAGELTLLKSIPRSNRRHIPNIVEPEIRTIAEIVSMVDRTIEELLQAPTEGYGEAIVIPEILAKIFEIKTNLIQLVQANKFHGHENDNPHTHISNFKRMTASLKYGDVSNDAIKLMLSPYSLEDRARI